MTALNVPPESARSLVEQSFLREIAGLNEQIAELQETLRSARDLVGVEQGAWQECQLTHSVRPAAFAPAPARTTNRTEQRAAAALAALLAFTVAAFVAARRLHHRAPGGLTDDRDRRDRQAPRVRYCRPSVHGSP